MKREALAKKKEKKYREAIYRWDFADREKTEKFVKIRVISEEIGEKL